MYASVAPDAGNQGRYTLAEHEDEIQLSIRGIDGSKAHDPARGAVATSIDQRLRRQGGRRGSLNSAAAAWWPRSSPTCTVGAAAGLARAGEVCIGSQPLEFLEQRPRMGSGLLPLTCPLIDHLALRDAGTQSERVFPRVGAGGASAVTAVPARRPPGFAIEAGGRFWNRGKGAPRAPLFTWRSAAASRGHPRESNFMPLSKPGAATTAARSSTRTATTPGTDERSPAI